MADLTDLFFTTGLDISRLCVNPASWHRIYSIGDSFVIATHIIQLGGWIKYSCEWSNNTNVSTEQTL